MFEYLFVILRTEKLLYMNFVEKNNAILEEWKASNLRHGEENFAPDGILYRGATHANEYCSWRDESGMENRLWANAKMRILFITKDQNAGEDEAWDVRTETGRVYLNSDSIPLAFYRNLMYQLYGLVHTTADSVCDYTFSNEDAIRLYDTYPVARINVKKEAGSSSVSYRKLRFYLERDREFIRRQIDNLDAHLIICCGYSKKIEETGNLLLNFLNNNGYSFKQFSNNGWIYYDEHRKKVAINAYHLSARISSEKMFTEMMADYHEFLNK